MDWNSVRQNGIWETAAADPNVGISFAQIDKHPIYMVVDVAIGVGMPVANDGTNTEELMRPVVTLRSVPAKTFMDKTGDVEESDLVDVAGIFMDPGDLAELVVQSMRFLACDHVGEELMKTIKKLIEQNHTCPQAPNGLSPIPTTD